MAKTIVIGIDGACWEYIDPLLKECRLPNIRKLMDHGSYGILQSVLPPISPVAWSSILTGTNPGKHGVFGWKKIDRKNSYIPVLSYDRKEIPFWQYINSAGKKVGIFNIPVNYPIQKIDGYVLPGFEAPTNKEDCVYPLNLYGEIKERYGDFLNKLPLKLLSDFERLEEFGTESYFEKYCFSEEMRTKLALDVSEDCDVVLFNYMITDHLNHQLKEFEFVNKAYDFVDKMIGRWLERFPDDNYILMSDHGSTRIKGIVNLNHLFFNKGYLRLRKRQISSLKKEEVNEILHFILCGQGLKEGIYEKLLRRIKLFWLYFNSKERRFNKLKDLCESEPDVFNSFLYLNQIDYKKTLLHINSDDGFIFLNKKYLEENEKNYKTHYKEIVKDLMDYNDPITNKPFFDFISKPKDFLKGEELKFAPEIYGHFFESEFFVTTKIDYNKFKSTDPCKRINDEKDIGIYGSHQRNGIYITFGPQFKNRNGKKGKTYSLLDITPTLLYLHDESISENFDGNIMVDAIAPEYIRKNPTEQSIAVEYSSKEDKSELDAEDKQQIIEKLRKLGYIN